MSARGVWNTLDKTFFDIRVFHPGAQSNQTKTVEEAFKKHEDEKKRTYNRRILEVEKATFTPLVYSTLGGMGQESEKFTTRVASLIAKKRDMPYSECVSFLRKRISFCLLRTVLVALRGYRGRPIRKNDENSDFEVINDQVVVY